MKTFKEFIFEENANKIVQFKRKLAGATDPAEIERLRKAIADAQKGSSANTNPLPDQSYKAPEVPKKAGPGTRAGGSNQPIPGQPKASSATGAVNKLKTGLPKIPRPTAGQVGSFAMGGLQVAGTGYDIYDRTTQRQAQGERLRTAVPKAAAEAGGGLAGSVAAAKLAAKVLPKNPYIAIPGTLAAGYYGYTAGAKGSEGIIKKLESPFGGGDKELEKANQKRGVQQSRSGMRAANVYGATKGSALTGLGGPAKVDTKARTLTTKGKTVKLASTQLVRDPKTGQQRVGDLAYKGGKATYIARASTASRDSNASPGGVFRNIQRSLNIGGQRERDAAAAKTEYRTALKNTQAYTKGLGISTKSATAQKLPGYGTAPAAKPKPKPTVKPQVAGGGMGGARGSGSSPSVKK